MDRSQSLHGFHLDQKSVFDNQIDAESRVVAHPFEHDVDRPLPIDLQPLACQTTRQHHFINAFEESGREITRTSNNAIDNLAEKVLDLAHSLSAPRRHL